MGTANNFQQNQSPLPERKGPQDFLPEQLAAPRERRSESSRDNQLFGEPESSSSSCLEVTDLILFTVQCR